MLKSAESVLVGDGVVNVSAGQLPNPPRSARGFVRHEVSEREQHFFFPSGSNILYGTLHTPTPESFVGKGIVFCSAFCDEQKSAYKLLADAARRFSECGFHVMRFDFGGCGDSAGDMARASLSQWIDDLAAAIRVLTRVSEVETIGLLGLRLGASLAAEMADRDSRVQFLALWSPIVNGSRYIELTAKRRHLLSLWQEHRAVSHDEEPKPLGHGPNDITDHLGYPIGRELARDIEWLRLSGSKRRIEGPILLASIGTSSATDKDYVALADAYRQRSDDVTTVAIPGDPFWSHLGISKWPALLDTTERWLMDYAHC